MIDAHVHREEGDILPDEPTPTQGGASGGELARDVGKRDEQKRATGSRSGVTRATKSDEVQPQPATRSDRRGSGG
ncbi:hypothetical protein [Sphingopyxis sp. PAMC25046]|uniref:hypothetical protein n=1 Tax=Sphingopyxis sp. PAMC25046 TaxID=2565556 RepID=UPI001445C972|nr:hypothetical protein [Sphingopyxis sp. PAMC25046]